MQTAGFRRRSLVSEHATRIFSHEARSTPTKPGIQIRRSSGSGVCNKVGGCVYDYIGALCYCATASVWSIKCSENFVSTSETVTWDHSRFSLSSAINSRIDDSRTHDCVRCPTSFKVPRAPHDPHRNTGHLGPGRAGVSCSPCDPQPSGLGLLASLQSARFPGSPPRTLVGHALDLGVHILTLPSHQPAEDTEGNVHETPPPLTSAPTRFPSLPLQFARATEPEAAPTLTDELVDLPLNTPSDAPTYSEESVDSPSLHVSGIPVPRWKC